MIVFIDSDDMKMFLAGLAILFTLGGVLIFNYQENEQKAQAVRDWRNVNALEARLDRFDQVIAMYNIKAIPPRGKSRD